MIGCALLYACLSEYSEVSFGIDLLVYQKISLQWLIQVLCCYFFMFRSGLVVK